MLGAEGERQAQKKSLLTREMEAEHVRRKVNLSARLPSWSISRFLYNEGGVGWGVVGVVMGRLVLPVEIMDRLLRGPGGALSWDGAGKINPRALSQLSKSYGLKGLMNILWPIFSGKSNPAVSWSEYRRTLACQG